MHRKVLRYMALFFSVSALIIIVYSVIHFCNKNSCICIIEIDGIEYEIEPINVDNSEDYWLFLPSIVKPNSVTIKADFTSHTDVLYITNKTASIPINNHAKTTINLESCFINAPDNKIYSIKISDPFNKAPDMNINIAFSNNVSTVIMESTALSDGKAYVDSSQNHSKKTPSNILILSPTGEKLYANSTTIRGHGNASWYGTDKKSYRLDLETGFSFNDDFESSTKWLLISNAMDPTLLHNLITYKSASELYMNYVPDCELVDFYWDGSYCGNYLLLQKIAWSDIEIDKIYNSDVEKGLLLEEDSAYYMDENNWIKLESNNIYSIKNCNNLTESALVDLTNFLQKAENSLSQQDEIKKYYDMKSLCAYYLLQEYYKNKDSYFSSTYWYINNGILYAGPIWDFDISMGIPLEHDLTNPCNRWANVRGSAWFFSKNIYFQDALKNYWNIFSSSVIKVLLGEREGNYLHSLSYYKEIYEDAANMNYHLWEMQNHYLGSNTTDFLTFDSWSNSIDYTIDFLTQRGNWLDDELKRSGSTIDLVSLSFLNDSIMLDGSLKSCWIGGSFSSNDAHEKFIVVIANDNCQFSNNVKVNVNGTYTNNFSLLNENTRLEVYIDEEQNEF